jgi:hypothetical protein
MTEQVAEKKSEVMKLGANMTEEQRAELENFEKHAKQNAGLQIDEEVVEEEQKKEVVPCRRCGYAEGDTKPPEDDMQEYMRSVLGNRRFSKTYELMRGQIKVTFTTIDTNASERVNKIIDRLSVLEDPVQFRAVATKINMAYMLTSYTMGGETKELEVSQATTPETVTKDFVERFGDMDESIIQLLTRAMGTFITLKSALIDECFDEAFYKGAGPF